MISTHRQCGTVWIWCRWSWLWFRRRRRWWFARDQIIASNSVQRSSICISLLSLPIFDHAVPWCTYRMHHTWQRRIRAIRTPLSNSRQSYHPSFASSLIYLTPPLPSQIGCYPPKGVDCKKVSLNLVKFIGYDPKLNLGLYTLRPFLSLPPDPSAISPFNPLSPASPSLSFMIHSIVHLLGLIQWGISPLVLDYLVAKILFGILLTSSTPPYIYSPTFSSSSPWSNFDHNGLLYWLGTQKGTSSVFTNPYLAGAVDIKLSHKMSHYFSHSSLILIIRYQDTMKIEHLIDRSLNVTYFGGSCPQSFVFLVWCCWILMTSMILDLKEQSIWPSHITLRHGYNYPNSYLTNFKILGILPSLFPLSSKFVWLAHVHQEVVIKLYGMKFITRKPQYSAQALMYSTTLSLHSRISQPQVATIAIPKTISFYRYIQVKQLSNYAMGSGQGAPYLCLAGVELYGRVKVAKGK